MDDPGWSPVEPSTVGAEMSRAARLDRYGAVSTYLALLGDRRLGELLEQASPIVSGIGGAPSIVDVDGVKVFAKRVPLTDTERRPEYVMSTANLFRLPMFYQYGVGSAGFGAWRELAVHIMTTNWVLGNESPSFPLLYHWRVLPRPSVPPSTCDGREAVERAVGYWAGSPSVHQRLEEINRSSANVVLFLEYIPQTLGGWLSARRAEGDEAVDSACGMVERSLRAGTSFMNSRALLHFDAHFENILTDGRHLYFADFGLAMSSRFELSASERAFYAAHLSYDRCSTVTRLVDWLVAAAPGALDRDARVREFAEGTSPVRLPVTAFEIVRRYAPVAVLMNEFSQQLQTESRTIPYPVDEIERALAVAGLPMDLS